MMDLLTMIGKGIAYVLAGISLVYFAFYALVYLIAVVGAIICSIG